MKGEYNMKKLHAFIVMCIISLSLAGCTMTQSPKPSQQPTSTQTAPSSETTMPTSTSDTTTDMAFIGEERAEEIALEKAGLTAEDVTFINIDLDRDDGIWKYELEFRQGSTEYETDINAIDGTILKWEIDTN